MIPEVAASHSDGWIITAIVTFGSIITSAIAAASRRQGKRAADQKAAIEKVAADQKSALELVAQEQRAAIKEVAAEQKEATAGVADAVGNVKVSVDAFGKKLEQIDQWCFGVNRDNGANGDIKKAKQNIHDIRDELQAGELAMQKVTDGLDRVSEEIDDLKERRQKQRRKRNVPVSRNTRSGRGRRKGE